eukprot:13711348-Alexandrium_andersonii.AAC.1
MSASLVGSEMCIRDSCSARSAAQASGGYAGASDRGQRHAQQGGHRQAVSYTHLTLPTICSV